jgi:hypothetical protein
MSYRLPAVFLLFLVSSTAVADIRELVPEDVLKSIAEETSGEAAKRNLDTITLQHRMRASSQFDAATQHILERLEHYGLDEVGTLDYAADGKTMFGTQNPARYGTCASPSSGKCKTKAAKCAAFANSATGTRCH